MRCVEQGILERSRKVTSIRTRPLPVELLERVQSLNIADQLLLRLAAEGRTYREVATIVGCDPGTVSRRLSEIRRRLRDPLVLALLEKKYPLPDDYREIGLDYYLRGRNIREIAELRNLSRFQVQQLVHFMRSWFSGWCANRQFQRRVLSD